MGRLDGRTQRGQATVELALTLPVVILALLLVVQVGLVARSQVLVVHAAREGARAAALGGSSSAVRAAAASSPGLDVRRMRVDVEVDVDVGVGVGVAGGGISGGALARVEVRYRAPTDVPLVGPLLGEPELTAEVAMRVEDPPTGPG